MITVDLIKQIYPGPIVAPIHGDDLSNGYCVGGAVCMMANIDNPFPGVERLADALCNLNNRLPWSIARLHADCIITSNDLGAFDTAWKTVEKMLTYGQVTL